MRRIGLWLRPGGVFLATFGSGPPHETVDDDWLGAPMFFSGFDEKTNERLVVEAGLTIVQSCVERQLEPETAREAGTAPVAFHWLLAQKASS